MRYLFLIAVFAFGWLAHSLVDYAQEPATDSIAAHTSLGMQHPLVDTLATTGYTNEYNNEIRRVAALYYSAEYRRDIYVIRLKSLIICESGFDEQAVSPAGALNLGQQMPATYAELAERYDLSRRITAKSSLHAAGAYIQERREYWYKDRPEPMDKDRLAVPCYNAGCGNIRRAQAKAEADRGRDVLLWRDIAPYLHLTTGKYADETIRHSACVDRTADKILAGAI